MCRIPKRVSVQGNKNDAISLNHFCEFANLVLSQFRVLERSNGGMHAEGTRY